MSSVAQVSDALKRVLTVRAKELERATGFVQRSTAELLSRFNGVYVQDGTIISLPAELGDEQPNAVERRTRRHYRRAVCTMWMGAISRWERCERTARRGAPG